MSPARTARFAACARSVGADERATDRIEQAMAARRIDEFMAFSRRAALDQRTECRRVNVPWHAFLERKRGPTIESDGDLRLDRPVEPREPVEQRLFFRRTDT